MEDSLAASHPGAVHRVLAAPELPQPGRGPKHAAQILEVNTKN